LWVIAEIPNNLHRHIRHPMLSGVILWAIGHLMANGDLRSIILFVSLGLFSVLAIATTKKPPRHALPVGRYRDVLAILLAVIIYALLARYHGILFGMPISHYYS